MSGDRLQILAFEPFDAGSHRAVRRSLSRHGTHQWTWHTRPGRAWKWRMRLAAWELAATANEAGDFDRADVVFATSLLAAADLRAAMPAGRRDLPLVLYMHENQAAYPVGFETELSAERDVQFALTNLSGILAAERVIWNSEWNRESFIAGLESLLRRAPDTTVGDVTASIRARSTVAWPPVEPPARPDEVLHKPAMPGRRGSGGAEAGPVRIAWPHRWEHDKGPAELLSLALEHSDRLNLRWTILGERYRDAPPELAEFERRLASRIDHIGFEPDHDRYLARLAECDWVLSTARHEFFGIAVVEAMLCGCLPWLPDRLSYPEVLPPIARGLSPSSPPRDEDAVRQAIAAHLRPSLAAESVRRIEAEVVSATGQSARPHPNRSS